VGFLSLKMLEEFLSYKLGVYVVLAHDWGCKNAIYVVTNLGLLPIHFN